jgi:TP901 family phage tail tape measure protein
VAATADMIAKLAVELEASGAISSAKKVSAVLTRLSKEATQTTAKMQKMDNMTRAVERSMKQSGKQMGDLDTAMHRLALATEKQTKSLDGLVKQNQRLMRSHQALRMAMNPLNKIADTLINVFRRLAQMLGFVLVGAVGLVIKKFVDFEQEMVKIETLVGINRQQVEKWSGGVRKLAVQTGVAAQELSKAMFAITSGGTRGEAAMEALTQIAKGTALGLGDAAAAGRTVAAALQAFGHMGLTATKAVDAFIVAIQRGNLVTERLAPTLGRAMGVAAEFGVSFEEATAFVSAFSRLGVPASEAVTSLNSTLSALLKPTDQQIEAMSRLNLTTKDITDSLGERGLARTFVDIIKLTKEKAESDDEAREILGKLLPNIRALRGVLATAGAQMEDFIKIEDDIRNSLGETDRQFARQQETVKQAFNRMKAAFVELGMVFVEGLRPAIIGVANSMRLWLMDEDMRASLRELGQSMGALLDKFLVGDAEGRIDALARKFRWLAENVDKLAGALFTLGSIGAVAIIGKITAAVASLAATTSTVAAGFAALFVGGTFLLGQELYRQSEVNDAIEAHAKRKLDLRTVNQQLLDSQIDLQRQMNDMRDGTWKPTADMLSMAKDKTEEMARAISTLKSRMSKPSELLKILKAEKQGLEDALKSGAREKDELLKQAAAIAKVQESIDDVTLTLRREEEQLLRAQGAMEGWIDFQKAVEAALREKRKLHVGNIELTEEELLALAKLTDAIEKQTLDLEKQIALEMARQRELKGEADQVLLVTQMYERLALERSIDADAMGEQGEALMALLERLQVLQRETVQLERNMKFFKEMKDGNVMFGMGYTTINLEDTKKKVKEVASTTENLYKKMLNGIRNAFKDTFEQIFKGNLDGFKDFFDSILDLFAKLLAEMASMMASKKLFGKLGLVDPKTGEATGSSLGDVWDNAFKTDDAGKLANKGAAAMMGAVVGAMGGGMIANQMKGDKRVGQAAGAIFGAIGAALGGPQGMAIGTAIGGVLGGLMKKSIPKGIVEVKGISGGLGAAVHGAFRDVLQGVGDSIVKAVDDFAKDMGGVGVSGISGDLAVRKIGDNWAVLVNGYAKKFGEDYEAAVSYATAKAIKMSNFRGLSPLIQQAIDNAATDMDAIKEAVDIAKQIEVLAFGEGAISIRNATAQLRALYAEATSLGLDLQVVTQAMVNGFVDMRNQILGIQDEGFAGRLAEATSFNAQLFDWIADTVARIELLKEQLSISETPLGERGFEGIEGIDSVGRRIGGASRRSAEEIRAEIEELERALREVPGAIDLDQFLGSLISDFGFGGGIGAEAENIRLTAENLRQAVQRLGEQSELSEKQIDEYTKAIDRAEKQRLRSLQFDVLDKLFAYVEGTKKFEAERMKLAKDKVRLEFAMIKAQLMALDLWGKYAKIWREIRREALAIAGKFAEVARGGNKGLVDDIAKGVRKGVTDGMEPVVGAIKTTSTSVPWWERMWNATAPLDSLFRKSQGESTPLTQSLIEGYRQAYEETLKAFPESSDRHAQAIEHLLRQFEKAFERLIETIQTNLTEYRNSLITNPDFGVGTPAERVAAKRREIDDLMAIIMDPTADPMARAAALEQLQGLSDEYLKLAAEAYGTSSEAFAGIFADILGFLDAAANVDIPAPTPTEDDGSEPWDNLSMVMGDGLGAVASGLTQLREELMPETQAQTRTLRGIRYLLSNPVQVIPV